MRRFWIWILVSICSGGMVWAQEEEPGEWTLLSANSLPSEWAEFAEKVASHPWVVADFMEKRYFSFRSRPVELSGTVWFGREEGLTLAYKEPRREIVRIVETGMRIIPEKGPTRSRAVGERGGEVPSALLAMFRFDLRELEKDFVLEGDWQERNWRLRLTPREETDSPLQRIVLGGTDEEVSQVSVEMDGSARIDLRFSKTAYPEDLGAEERAKIFP